MKIFVHYIDRDKKGNDKEVYGEFELLEEGTFFILAIIGGAIGTVFGGLRKSGLM